MFLDYDCSKWRTFVCMDDDSLLKFCEVKFTRGSGKGGQKRNKTSNKAQIFFSHLQVSDDSSRSSALNKKLALRKLRIKISLDFKTPNCSRPVPAKYYLDNKTSVNLRSIKENHPDYPFFCGWLLDAFISTGFDWHKLNAFGYFNASQLTKWFLANPAVKKTLLDAKQTLS